MTAPVERVLILHDYAGGRGGAELIALDLRRLLRRRGVDARLMAGDADPWAADDAPDYPFRGDTGRLRALTETVNLDARARLARVLAEFRPEVVHMVMFLTQASPAVLPLLARTPTVYSINTYRSVCPTGTRWRPGDGACERRAGLGCAAAGCLSPWGVAPRRLQLALVRRGRGAIDLTVAPSRAMAAVFEAQGWPVDRIIPHGVAERARSRPPAARPTVAFAGRLVPEKGAAWLLAAFAAAGPALAAARLLIVGDGPERAALEAEADRLGLSARIEFAGHRPREEAERLLEAAWVQVVPSLWPEPFGLVVAEAMMRATPVVASDAGAPGELVRHGETGLVVRAGDTAGLAEALAALLADPARATRMGEAGRAAALAAYSHDRWIDAYLDVYAAAGRGRG